MNWIYSLSFKSSLPLLWCLLWFFATVVHKIWGLLQIFYPNWISQNFEEIQSACVPRLCLKLLLNDLTKQRPEISLISYFWQHSQHKIANSRSGANLNPRPHQAVRQCQVHGANELRKLRLLSFNFDCIANCKIFMDCARMPVARKLATCWANR